MREHVKVEVAIEIISMCIAIAVDNNDLERAEKLNQEKDRIYSGDMEFIDKVINQYGKECKQLIKGNE